MKKLTRERVSNPRWPIPRKESNKCKEGRRVQDIFGRAEKMEVREKRELNDFVIDCFMIDEKLDVGEREMRLRKSVCFLLWFFF